MKSLFFAVLFSLAIFDCVAQAEFGKEKFVSEKWLHFKVGCLVNFYNAEMYKSLNRNTYDHFVSKKSAAINPTVDIEFENQFSKYVGLNIGIGFMQTRHHYSYSNDGSGNSGNPAKYTQDGVILCNIPHLNLRPSFYYKQTCLQVGLGFYKYYYNFKPLGVGNLRFDLNSEGQGFYSTIGVMQSFKLKSQKMTATASYFGFLKKFDSGFQLALGFAI